MGELQKNYDKLVEQNLDNVDRVLKLGNFILSIQDRLTKEELEEFSTLIK